MAAGARVERMPLADWRAVFATHPGEAPPPAATGEAHRSPAPAAIGWFDVRAVAAALAGAAGHTEDARTGASATANTTAILRGAAGHAALERLPLEPPDGFDLSSWLTAAGVAGADAPPLERFIVDSLWPALRPARQVAREHPFRLHLPGGGVVVGTMDCLWQDAGGAWWVWDYKFGPADAALDARHEGQLRLYALAAAAALNLSTVRGRLWHVTEGTAQDFTWDETDLAALEREIPGALLQLSAAP